MYTRHAIPGTYQKQHTTLNTTHDTQSQARITKNTRHAPGDDGELVVADGGLGRHELVQRVRLAGQLLEKVLVCPYY